MHLSAKNKALIFSFLRVLGAALVAAYLSLGKLPNDLTAGDLKFLYNAVIGAAGLTLVNYLRSGETRFGVGAQPDPPA